MCVNLAICTGNPIKSSAINLKIGGINPITITRVINTFKMLVNLLNLRNAWPSLTSAVEALMIIIIGASISKASENATPKAARLNLGSGSLAMMAAKKGPSTAIINQVAASGTQKEKIFF